LNKSKTVYALLGWLSTGSFSGYDLKKMTEQYVGEFWYGSFGQIYPLLHEMLRDGLVTVQTEQSGSHPPRQVYTITDSGRDLFRKWLNEPPEPDLYKSELLLQLFFGYLADPETLRKHVQESLDEATRQLTEYGHWQKTIPKQLANLPNLPYILITLDSGLVAVHGRIEWAKRTLEMLDTISSEPQLKKKTKR